MSKNDISRRDLFKGSALAMMGLGASGSALADVFNTENLEPVATPTPPEKLKFGIIGCGGKGWSGMTLAAEQGEITAIVDVDAKNRGKASEEFPRAATFNDYRDMLDAMKGDINAVVISTPDHHHAIASAMAMKMGLHTYCEKPLTRTIWEARQLATIARKMKVATQMGNQSTASTPMRKIAAAIRSGHFGAVKEVHVWTNRPIWPQGIERAAPKPTPKQLDFDMWLGPAPDRPHADHYHSFEWRGWWDFGTGALGDMGCHIMNMVHMALDLRDPLSVQAKTSGHNRDSFPNWSIVDYDFGARGSRGPLHLRWYDGGKKPDAALIPGYEVGGNGVIVVCEKATLFGEDESNTNFHVIGGGTIPDMPVDESPGHMAEFARAAKGGKPAASNFPNYAGPLTETVLLGNLAIWADGPKLDWDAKNLKVKGSTEFDKLIVPAYQHGFHL